jgi:hypothetical protein
MADAKKYTSRFTGSEIDAAIRRALGAEYGDTIIPGTRLVGRTSDNPIDLNELTYPGIYTAYFYRHGPRELEKLNGTTPISIMVYNDAEYSAAEAQAQENSNSEVEDTLTLRQTILSLSYAADTSLASSGFDEGSRVVYMFYRDFDALTASGGMAYLDSGAGASGYGWEKLLLSNGNLTVINNLESSSAENVLSANMGRYLKALIDGDDDGGVNLLVASNGHSEAINPAQGLFFSNVWNTYILPNTGVETTSSLNEDSEGTTVVQRANEFDGTIGRISDMSKTYPPTAEDIPSGYRNFDPGKYFLSYNRDDYIRITTIDANQHSKVGFKLKEEYEVPLNANDDAFTVSAYVHGQPNSINSSKAFVEIRLATGSHVSTKFKDDIVEDSGETYSALSADLQFLRNEQGQLMTFTHTKLKSDTNRWEVAWDDDSWTIDDWLATDWEDAGVSPYTTISPITIGEENMAKIDPIVIDTNDYNFKRNIDGTLKWESDNLDTSNPYDSSDASNHPVIDDDTFLGSVYGTDFIYYRQNGASGPLLNIAGYVEPDPSAIPILISIATGSQGFKYRRNGTTGDLIDDQGQNLIWVDEESILRNRVDEFNQLVDPILTEVPTILKSGITIRKTAYSYAVDNIKLNELPSSDQWYKLSATISNIQKLIKQANLDVASAGNDAIKYVTCIFGIEGAGTVYFSNLKLERGKVATDYTPSLAEMWYIFDNANTINMVPLDNTSTSLNGLFQSGLANSIKTAIATGNEAVVPQQKRFKGLVFKQDPNGNKYGSWVSRYLATGGGGGFVVSDVPPSDEDGTPLTEVLWYVYKLNASGKEDTSYVYSSSYSSSEVISKCYEGAFYFFDDTIKNWKPCEHNYFMTEANDPPKNPGVFWLRKTAANTGRIPGYSQLEPPDLMYFDSETDSWRRVGAEPRAAWVIQDEEPTGEDADLMWITTKGIASVPYYDRNGNKKWLPIQAIWGNND